MNTWKTENRNEMMHGFFPGIGEREKFAFICALFAAIITHLYMFTNEIVNHDDVNRLLVGDTDEVKIQHGRWAGVIFDRVSGSMAGIPYIIGVLSVVAIAGGCVVLAAILKTERKLTTLLICLLVCTFPVAANIFLYIYIADIYFISMFLAMWGIWLLLREEYSKNAFGIILLTLSCGCYQAFWCMGISVLFLFFVLEFCSDQSELKKLMKKALKCFVMAGISLVLYLIINKLVQTLTGFGATTYQGLDSMGAFQNILDMLKVVAYAYYEFFYFFYRKGYFVSSPAIVIINVVLTVWVLVMLVQKSKEKQGRAGKWIILLFILGMIPLMSNLISVASHNVTHVLMQYGFLLPYLMCIMLSERKALSRNNGRKGSSLIVGIAYLFIAIIAYKGFITDNEVYFRQQLNYEATYSYTTRLLYRIEEFEGYEPDMQVAIINENPQIKDHITIMLENYPEEMGYFDYLNDMVGTEPHTFVKRANDISDFCKHFHGYDLKLAETEKFAELAETKEFQEMKTYPDKEGMKIIDGILVIKLPG